MIWLIIVIAFTVGTGAGLAVGIMLSARWAASVSGQHETDALSQSPWTSPSNPTVHVTTEPKEEPTLAEELHARLEQIEDPVVLGPAHRARVRRYLKERNKEILNAIGRPIG